MTAPADFHPVCPECGDENFPRALKCASCGTKLYLFTSSCVYCGWPTMYRRRECIGHCDLNDDAFASLDGSLGAGLHSSADGQST